MKTALQRVLTSAFLASLCALARAEQPTQEVALNIDAPKLARALIQLTEQTGLQLVFPAGEKVTDLPSSSLIGTYKPQAALERLLAGSGLQYEFIDDRTIAVLPLRTSLSSRAKGLLYARADANDESGVEQSGSEPQEVTVTAAPYRFLDADTSGTTNLPLPIEKVPQSITLLSADFMEAAGIRKAENLDDYVAGMSDAGELTSSFGSVSRQYIRGFRTGFFYSRYIDGLPVPEYTPEHAFIDRVEIVKGPSSVTYGIATPGGLYNFVPKRAPKSPSARFSGEAGSWNSYRIEAEGGGALNSKPHCWTAISTSRPPTG